MTFVSEQTIIQPNEHSLVHLLERFAMTRILYYTIPEVCSLLKVSRSTVYRLIESRDLFVVHINTAPRITAESFDEYRTKRYRIARGGEQ